MADVFVLELVANMQVGIQEMRAEVMHVGKAEAIKSFQKDGSTMAMVSAGIKLTLRHGSN